MTYEVRQVHKFTCKDCGKKNRVTFYEYVAVKGICRKCRFPKVAKGQIELFANL